METNRIILRPWRDSDAETLFKWASDPDVGPRAGWAPHNSVEESREIIRTVFNDGANRTQPSSLELLRYSPSSHSCNDATNTWAIELKKLVRRLVLWAMVLRASVICLPQATTSRGEETDAVTGHRNQVAASLEVATGTEQDGAETSFKNRARSGKATSV